MRRILLFTLILLGVVSLVKAQSPQFLNYQGIARNSNGTIITTAIGVKFEILQGSASGSVVYDETNTITPSTAGVFTTAIGSGAPGIGTFSAINWANGPYFIRVNIDPAGGTSYSTVGTSQLLSVPYALYAEKAGNVQTLTAGNGIAINSGTITNTSPNQTVNISGSGVTGSYPNYTINPSSALTASTGISIVGGTVTNTAPDQTVTISGAVGTYPNFTVTPTPATSLTATGTSILITGTGPGFTIVPQPSLTVSGNQLSILDGNTVTLPTGTTYTNGAGISLTSGTVITNSLPDQTVTISNGTNVTVNGTYPNFTVNAVPTLSLVGNALSISGGNTVTFPAPVSYAAGTGIAITSGSIINTAPNQTVTIGNGTNVNVTGTYPNFLVNATPSLSISGNTLSITGGTSVVLQPSTTVLPGPNILISGTSPTFVVGAPTYSLNFTTSSTGSLTNGFSGTSVSLPQPTLTLGGVNNNVLSAGSNSVSVATYTTGTGLTMGGTFPNFIISATSTGTSAAWSAIGNTGTNPGVNFLGTTDPQDLVFRTQNTQRMRIFNPSGFVGIGNITTPTELLQVESSSSLSAVSILSGTNAALYFGNAGNHQRGKITYDNSTDLMSFGTNGGSGFVGITSAGKVGIGTTGPSELLQLQSPGNTDLSILSPGGSLASLAFGFTGNHFMGRLQYDITNNSLSFWTNNISNRLFIDGNGRIGMGGHNLSSTPANVDLHVTRVGPNYGKILVSGGDASNSYGGMISFGENLNSSQGFTIKMDAVTNALGIHNDPNGASSPVMMIGGYSGYNPGVVIGQTFAYINPPNQGAIIEGNVGIGTSTPSQKLEVVGNVEIPATNEYLYAAPKTKYYSIPSVDFSPENATQYVSNSIVSHLFAASVTGTLGLGTATYFDAPVNLPDGATITQMDAYVVDNDGTYNISTVQLWRADSPTGSTFGTSSIMGSAGPTTGANPNIQLLSDNSIATPVVDNQNYSYYVRFGGAYTGSGPPGQNIRLARFVITYTVNKTD